ncbi:MAG: LytTR family transcriptional regulator [Saprospiraceae bacterium]|nr:LytTR family transcriptional regulator [Saprospiraceae bacterium]
MANEFSISEVSIFKKLLSPKLFPVIFGLVSGFLVFYFLYFFEAYGIQKGLSYSGHTHLFRCLSFGALTFGYLTAFETWFKSKFHVTNFIYLALWYIGLVFLGSQLIFILFNFFWNWQEWNLEAYALIIKEFPLMMVLPLSFYLILKTITAPQKLKISYLSFQSENGKDQLKVKLQDFLYANSSENYIAISYYSNGESKQHLIRKPLKVLEQELKAYPEIQKSHRSYLVNSHNIQSVKQIKGKVYLKVKEASVPVSKQYQNHFLD